MAYKLVEHVEKLGNPRDLAGFIICHRRVIDIYVYTCNTVCNWVSSVHRKESNGGHPCAILLHSFILSFSPRHRLYLCIRVFRREAELGSFLFCVYTNRQLPH